MKTVTVGLAQLEKWLEALESMRETLAAHDEPTTFNEDEAITAIKEALALAEKPSQSEHLEPVAHCEGGAEFCPVCLAETRSLALAAAIGYIQRNTPSLVSTEICNALNRIPDAKKMVAQSEQEPDWKVLVLAHNAKCDERCAKERCGYMPYSVAKGRHCPTCPVHEKIDVGTSPQQTA